ncbi:MAG: hypothetical protein EBY22_03865, partial [Gammaproteobacteria bacterium]|nr:hypothetical protein [Gammaproteobacteria bacterium]
DFGKNWEKMLAIKHAWAGIACIATNALVNAALTYAGVELLTGVLLAASITLPPVAAITALAAISAFFGGTASFILGTAFWIGQNELKPQSKPVITSKESKELQQYDTCKTAPAANQGNSKQQLLITNR